ncbi:MAG: hypothetical protein ACOC9Y_02060 [Chloroflexota bacterium]
MESIFEIFENIGGCFIAAAVLLVIAALVLCCVGVFFLGVF